MLAYKVTVDFGPEIGIKRTSAQITLNYSKAELVGRQVIGVVNFPPEQIGPIKSEFLIILSRRRIRHLGGARQNSPQQCEAGLVDLATNPLGAGLVALSTTDSISLTCCVDLALKLAPSRLGTLT